MRLMKLEVKLIRVHRTVDSSHISRHYKILYEKRACVRFDVKLSAEPWH